MKKNRLLGDFLFALLAEAGYNKRNNLRILFCYVACYVTSKKDMEKYIRKVTRQGKRSLSVVIPAEIVRELKIRERQKVVVKKYGKGVLITDWKK